MSPRRHLSKSHNILKLIISTILVFTGFFNFAQDRCSTMEAERMRVRDTRKLPGNEYFEKWFIEKQEEERNKLIPFGTDEDPLKIPIVVHVIHNGENYGVGTNITDEQIYSQIEVLNEDFQRKNADTIFTQTEFVGVASKLNIEFVLACQDENGLATTGIVRRKGPKTSYDISVSDRELLSSVSQWDPNIYLNIWVTNLSGQNIGLAQFPDYGQSNNPDGLPGLDDKLNKDNETTDGLVIDYQTFGSEEKVPGLDLKAQYNLGRSATHEVGHFFGLLHVWGDGGCFVDDFVEDTPNSENNYLGSCSDLPQSSCGSMDMFQNYLYYTDDACMNIFSADQVNRMLIILANAPRRASLVNSVGTVCPDDLLVDMAISEVLAPGKVLCEGSINPSIEVRNNGTVPIKDFGIKLLINNSEINYSYTGDTIRSGEAVQLIFETFELEDGVSEIEFELTDIPEDVDGRNDRASHIFAVDGQRNFIPLRQEFDDPSLDLTDWITINEDNQIGWETTELPYADNAASAFINFYQYEVRQEVDWLISPILDFSSAVEASMTFRISYARNLDFNDRLQILLTENCEGYFNTTIETYNSSDLAFTDSESFWEPQSIGDWKEFSVDLSEYAGKNDIRVAFRAINDYGNSLYLDDIEFYTVADDKRVTTARNSFTLYPNPANDGRFQIAFNTSERQEVVVNIYDQLGRAVLEKAYPNTLNQTYYFDFAGKQAGIYFVHVQGEDFVRSKKLLIRH